MIMIKKFYFLISIFTLFISLKAKSLLVPPDIAPRILKSKTSNQEGLQSCYPFAIAAAIENSYYWKGESGVVVSPLHLYVFLNRNSDYESRKNRKLLRVYTPEVIQILNATGPLVPDFILPERLMGFPSKFQHGIGDVPPIDKLGLYDFFKIPSINYRSLEQKIIDFGTDQILGNGNEVAYKERMYRAIARLKEYLYYENGAVTLGLNSNYLDKDFNAYSGIKKNNTVPANHVSRQGTDHSVAVIGYNSEGLFIRNSWNNREEIAYNESRFRQEYESYDVQSFRRYYFGQVYVNDVYLIPWRDLILENTAFTLTRHYYDSEKLLRFYRENEGKVGIAKAHYFCSSKNVPSDSIKRAVIEIHNDPERFTNNFFNILMNEVIGKNSSINYALMPYYKFPNGDVNIQRLVDFYENANKKLDDFYCLYDDQRFQKRRPLWMSSDNALKMAWNQYNLSLTTLRFMIVKYWHEALGLMLDYLR